MDSGSRGSRSPFDSPPEQESLDTAAPPQPWVQLRERVRRADAVVFATSEDTRVFLARFLEAFEEWIARLRHGERQTAESGATG